MLVMVKTLFIPPIFRPFLRDTCSWKEQLEKTKSWRLWSWKVRNEIGKNEVGKVEPKLDNFYLLKIRLKIFQLKWKLSNFKLSNLKVSIFSFFPTALSNFLSLFRPISKMKKYFNHFPQWLLLDFLCINWCRIDSLKFIFLSTIRLSS